MATESDMKNVYCGMEATPEEMDRYRANLAAQLFAEDGDKKSLQISRPPFWARPAVLAIAATMLLAITCTLYVSLKPAYPQQDYDALQTLIRTSDPTVLRDQALTKSDGKNLDGLNALMILARTSPPEQAIESAIRGLEIEPRREFRREYLEILLDNSELVPIDASLLETIMDNDDDETSLELFSLLLKFS